MKKNNQGFSLVELVAVMAIIAILSSVFAYNVGRISGYQAKECRKKIFSSLSNGQLLSLSKSRGGSATSDNAATCLVLVKYTGDNCNYCITVIEDVVTDVKKISKSKVTVQVAYDSSGTTVADIGTTGTLSKLGDAGSTLDGVGVHIAYNRASGAFLPDGSGNYIYQINAIAGKYQYEISLHPKTGRVQMGDRTKLQ